jgi:ATP-dependent Clp protease ATP-binding subunit ClpA
MADKGYDPKYGARPLRRVIQNLVEDALSEGMLAGRFSAGDIVVIDVEGDQLTFRAKGIEELTPSPAIVVEG